MAKRFSLIIGFIVLLVSCLGLPGCAPSEIELIFDENPKIAVGSDYSLAIDGEGNVWSWGINSEGQLGTGDLEDRNIPVKITEGIRYKTVDVGMFYRGYAIDEDGNVWTWGGATEEKGQEQVYQTTPIRIIEDKKFSSISVGTYHALAIDEDGNLWNWGSNESGVFGNAPGPISGYIPVSTPVPILSGKKFKQASAGDHFSFAIGEDGGLWFWGKIKESSLEDAKVILSQPMPKQIMPEVRFKRVCAGYSSALAIDEEDHLWGCGRNEFGQLGDGTTTNRSSFVRVKSNRRFVYPAPELFHSYAIDEDGQLWQWGRDGIFLEKTKEGYYLVPKRAMEGLLFTQIAVGMHQLLLAADGTVWARGANKYGQLGDGTNLDSPTPIPVFKR